MFLLDLVSKANESSTWRPYGCLPQSKSPVFQVGRSELGEQGLNFVKKGDGRGIIDHASAALVRLRNRMSQNRLREAPPYVSPKIAYF